jgi:DNA-binding LacI/PurR family transcriptional regulator
MGEMRIMNKIEQVAEHLMAELADGRWQGVMPGRLELAKELGVNPKTVEEALRLLERKGVLVPQGAGRRRLITIEKKPASAALKVRILLFERIDQGLPYHIDLLHRLREAGHAASFADKSLHELGMNVKRVAAYVKEVGADAWIVCAGSREILEWFAGQETPAFAKFGKPTGLSLPGIRVDKIPAMKTAVRRLHQLGHLRMVLMARQDQQKSHKGPTEQAFLDELSALGIATGSYNLPEWGDDIAGFYRCLDSLFQYTPPSALFLVEARLFVAAYLHLAQQGIAAPRGVSLICDDPDIAFSWCQPSVSHIHWDSRPVVLRTVRWVTNVSQGKEDLRQTLTTAVFVQGGTIGPAGA